MQDARGRHSAPALLLASGYVALTAAAAHLVNSIVAEPYLDEIFHIPQAQRYCQGQWKGYDPKLTTPPGLYVLSVAGARVTTVLQRILQISDRKTEKSFDLPCMTVPQLRYTCLLAAIAMPWILATYLRAGSETDGPKSAAETTSFVLAKPTSPMEALVKAEADPAGAAHTARSTVAARQAQVLRRRRRGVWGILGSTLEDAQLTLDVHTMALLPPMWFFGLLYYTDVPSTALVMSMLAAARNKKHGLAALFGVISLTLRQTNIIWVLFAIGESAITELGRHGLSIGPLAQSTLTQQITSIRNTLKIEVLCPLLRLLTWYIPLFAMSGAFLVINGSIVLGDKEHHQASLHWVQPWYGVAFATVFSWPSLIFDIFGTHADYKRSLKRFLSPLPLLPIVAAAVVAIHFGTVAHPFLLADNRHYAFYLWRRVINLTPWTRYVLTVPYAVAARAWWLALSRQRSIFWLLGLLVCLCAAVIPSPLIEPRYFLVPYLIARCELASRRPPPSKNTASTSLLLELAWFAVISSLSLYLFLQRPFRWADHQGWQRFMW